MSMMAALYQSMAAELSLKTSDFSRKNSSFAESAADRLLLSALAGCRKTVGEMSLGCNTGPL
jgi:hypothetical protein